MLYYASFCAPWLKVESAERADKILKKLKIQFDKTNFHDILYPCSPLNWLKPVSRTDDKKFKIFQNCA